MFPIRVGPQRITFMIGAEPQLAFIKAKDELPTRRAARARAGGGGGALAARRVRASLSRPRPYVFSHFYEPPSPRARARFPSRRAPAGPAAQAPCTNSRFARVRRGRVYDSPLDERSSR